MPKATAENAPQNATGAAPRDSDPLEGWIPWETRFSTAGAARVLVANGKPVEQIIPGGMREGKMVPGIPEARRQDKWKKVANEGKRDAMTLQERRKRLDLSLGEFARACNLGTAVASSIERGLEIPPDAVIADIARVLKCSPEEIRKNLPDPKQAAQDKMELAGLLGAVGAAKTHAKQQGFGVGASGRGELPCPACGSGTLRYSVAAVNGHMWGSCSNKECRARWME